MKIKELFEKIGDTSYPQKFQNQPTLKGMNITKRTITLIDRWAKKMTTYGMLATYIPELKNVNKDLTAIAIGDLHNNRVIVGTGSKIKVSAQSVIKPFLYLYALEKGVSPENIAGMTATFMPFYTDRILRPELKMKIPDHPLGNAGAISSAAAIKNFDDFAEFMSKITGNPNIKILDKIFESEFEVNSNNRAIANRLVSSGCFKNTGEGERAYTNYTKACSLGLTVDDALNASLVLASGGVRIQNNKRIAKMNNAVIVMSAMNSYGLYEQSGLISLIVSGARANTSKSAVSGLIININPGEGAFVTYSPLLNSKGNSVYGLYASIPLNNLLALPGGMRLDVDGLNRLLENYNKKESIRVHKQIISLIRRGEGLKIFRTDSKILKHLKHTYSIQERYLINLRKSSKRRDIDLH
ncbi:MAG: glutaminase [Candidatus Aenigmarchaeota archaeon]|nr:glutaminase [Candidatus Aenigmarchaeota archaeon]